MNMKTLVLPWVSLFLICLASVFANTKQIKEYNETSPLQLITDKRDSKPDNGKFYRQKKYLKNNTLNNQWVLLKQ